MPPQTGLFTFFYPTNADAERATLDTYTAALPELRSPDSLCTTSSHWTPATRKKALPYSKLTASFPDSLAERPVLSGLNVFTDVERGLGVHEDFRSRVEKPGRFAAPPEIAQWQFAGGFLSRHAREDGKRNEKGERVMVITAFFKVKDEEGSMQGFVDAMGKAAEGVKASEPGTLTYSFFTNDNNEVLVFERYSEVADFKHHCSTDAFKKNGKATGKFLELKKTRFAEWEEIEGCFVGSQLPGGEKGGVAKL